MRNCVVIMADDQRWDTLWAMPIVQETLIQHGVHFTHAFVSTPLCGPSRASFFAGGYYAHNTGVLTNGLPNGGASRFVDTNTLPLRLQRQGYATALVGKYMNDYAFPYVPPGWSRFVAWNGGSSFAYPVMIGSSTEQSSTGSIERKAQYLTDFLRDEALAFLATVGTQPFFLCVTPFAPHPPAVPAPEDGALFSAYRYRGRGYGEADRHDKPAYVRDSVPRDVAQEDTIHRQQLRALQAVDRLVGALVEQLRALGQLDNTMIVYMADNSVLWGEHGLDLKSYPYDEALRVPLVIATPGILPREDHALVLANLDVPATLAAVAGLPPATDGQDLLPLLQDPRVLWRPEGLFVESFSRLWTGWRTHDAKYVEHGSGERELYDLVADPYELVNIVADPAQDLLVDELAGRVAALRGLDISDAAPSVGLVGLSYTYQLQAWGGTPPYTWSIVRGRLPVGLVLEASGVIHGLPTRVQTRLVTFSVQDASVSAQSQRPQQFTRVLSLVIAGEGS